MLCTTYRDCFPRGALPCPRGHGFPFVGRECPQDAADLALALCDAARSTGQMDGLMEWCRDVNRRGLASMDAAGREP